MNSPRFPFRLHRGYATAHRARHVQIHIQVSVELAASKVFTALAHDPRAGQLDDQRLDDGMARVRRKVAIDAYRFSRNRPLEPPVSDELFEQLVHSPLTVPALAAGCHDLERRGA